MSNEQSMDGFTAGVLLQTAMNGSNSDDIYKIYKDLQEDKDALTPEVIELVNSWKDKTCNIKFTSHKGIIKGPNTSSYGFYPGGRYPVIVKIIDSDMKKVIGKTFEYGLDQIELID